MEFFRTRLPKLGGKLFFSPQLFFIAGNYLLNYSFPGVQQPPSGVRGGAAGSHVLLLHGQEAPKGLPGNPAVLRSQNGHRRTESGAGNFWSMAFAPDYHIFRKRRQGWTIDSKINVFIASDYHIFRKRRQGWTIDSKINVFTPQR